jgi:hypothetical protein
MNYVHLGAGGAGSEWNRLRQLCDCGRVGQPDGF